MPIREEVLAIVKGPLKPVFESLFTETGEPKCGMEIRPILQVELPIEPVYKWSQKVSAWLGREGDCLSYHSENGMWLDLTRLIGNTSFSDAATCSVITDYSEHKHGHFKFNPAYSAYRQTHYTNWIFEKRPADCIAARTAGGALPDAMQEYQGFFNEVLRGYSPVDIAIIRGKNITAKALLQSTAEDMSVCIGIAAGSAEKPCFEIKSLWLHSDVPVGPKSKMMYDLASKSPVEDGAVLLHSKLGVAISAGNIEIAKFILGLGYVPDRDDCADIKASFGPPRAIEFLNSLSEGVARETVVSVLAVFHEVGVDPTVEVLGADVAAAA